ncbi:hypothetical protein K440DRAFT_12197 [Wilcoxina mikolae CBS 423.85]|nr:hypothetical protein K440DRAFT_12197 [Wilcoxina mikolae CBS 423.85]
MEEHHHYRSEDEGVCGFIIYWDRKMCSFVFFFLLALCMHTSSISLGFWIFSCKRSSCLATSLFCLFLAVLLLLVSISP